MSAPRPYETNPFHPPALLRHPIIVSIDIYILEFCKYFFLMVFTLCLGTEYTRHLRMRFSRLPLTLSYEVILSSIQHVLVGIGTKYIAFAHVHFLIWGNSQPYREVQLFVSEGKL